MTTQPPCRLNTIVPVVTTVVLTLGLAGCPSMPVPVEGAREPPASWKPVVTADCAALSGAYSEFGTPAPGNASAFMYTVVWPVTGSLVSFVERGVNSASRLGAPSVSIDVPAGGTPAFSVPSSTGATLPLTPREWWCEGGALVTRTALGTTAPTYSEKDHAESYIRLWKAEDGALIAENTFRSVEQRHRGTAAHEPFSRFYFRFPAVNAPVEP